MPCKREKMYFREEQNQAILMSKDRDQRIKELGEKLREKESELKKERGVTEKMSKTILEFGICIGEWKLKYDRMEQMYEVVERQRNQLLAEQEPDSNE